MKKWRRKSRKKFKENKKKVKENLWKFEKYRKKSEKEKFYVKVFSENFCGFFRLLLEGGSREKESKVSDLSPETILFCRWEDRKKWGKEIEGPFLIM